MRLISLLVPEFVSLIREDGASSGITAVPNDSLLNTTYAITFLYFVTVADSVLALLNDNS